jgi:hypothetical protein
MTDDIDTKPDLKVVPIFGNRIHPDEYIPEDEEYTPELPTPEEMIELANGSRIRGIFVIALNDAGDYTNYADGLSQAEVLAGLSVSQTLTVLRNYGVS